MFFPRKIRALFKPTFLRKLAIKTYYFNNRPRETNLDKSEKKYVDILLFVFRINML